MIPAAVRRASRKSSGASMRALMPTVLRPASRAMRIFDADGDAATWLGAGYAR
jgi:hypothetical protein